MRYLMALICPPVALMACQKWGQAVPAALLFALAVATAGYGVGPLVDVVLIIWACNVVSETKATREAQAFIKTVKPIPIIRH